MAAFEPTFADAPNNETTITKGSSLDELDISMDLEEHKHQFIFLMDRSGSMSGSRMQTSIDALVLFI
jgi:uncharacterized protein with von Willebrand factor type A (vWA) domain